MAKSAGLSYIAKDTPIHRLTGASKLLTVLFTSLAAMLTYDTRFLLGIIALSFTVLAVSRVSLKDFRLILTVLFTIMIFNNIFLYLFSPEHGVSVYGTRVVWAHLFGGYYITREQMFYQLNFIIKFLAIIPLALIFFVTTEPSEFAASLNAVGVSYKAAYSVSLALRYIPTVQREFREISQAQQARGVDISNKAKLSRRIKGVSSILFPLVITSIDKIESVANAMELRGFGKNKKRTWYRSRPFKLADFIIMAFGVTLICVSIFLNTINGGRFYNPFL